MPAPRHAFEPISPEEAGYSPENLAQLRAFLQRSGSETPLLLHDGKVVFEWGDIHKKLSVFDAQGLAEPALRHPPGPWRNRPAGHAGATGHKLVMVHRVDTERGSRFNHGDLFQLIRLMHAARLEQP